MKKIAWIMSGCMAVNGLFVVSNLAFAADPPAAADTQDNGGMKGAMDRVGAGTPTADNPAPDAKDIRKQIAKVTTQALTKGDLKHLVGSFSKDDEDRIEKADTYDQNYGDTLDGRIEQLNKAWKEKYGHEFSISDANATFGEDFAFIQQGIVGRDNELAKAVNKQDDGAAADTKSNSELENGRGIAMVTVKGMHGMGELKVPLIHELPDSWKINVPSGMDANALRQSLLTHLTTLGEHFAEWPADENEAYRAVAYHVLMAVMNQPVAPPK